MLTDKNLDFYNEIKNTKNSTSIHIRRGDYLEFAVKKEIVIPQEDYFISAINLLKEKIGNKKIKLFFFSNDMDWVKEKLIPLVKDDYTLVEGNDEKAGYIDFYLLMCCNHQIGSVGGFAWKAHFFNRYKNKLLIMPKGNKGIKPHIIEDPTL